jgi:S1-C subfamily serine protease
MNSRRINIINANSPAARSGLQIGDEIESVNGQRTSRFGEVLQALDVATIGDQLALTIQRGGGAVEVSLQVEAAPRPLRPVPLGPLVE